MAYIYKISNDINNKLYIGKTLETIQKRWKSHISDMNKREYEKRPLYNAMKKYGVEHFTIEELEECSAEESSEREIYWIKFYNSFSEGYNATIGGDGRAYADYEKIIALWNENYNCTEIHNITGYDMNTIKVALNNNNIFSEDVIKRKMNKYKKAVAKLDKDTEEIICVYSSISEAEIDIGYRPGKSHISQCCNGKRNTVKGYKWKFV